jgi:hypothetical protein
MMPGAFHALQSIILRLPAIFRSAGVRTSKDDHAVFCRADQLANEILICDPEVSAVAFTCSRSGSGCTTMHKP